MSNEPINTDALQAGIAALRVFRTEMMGVDDFATFGRIDAEHAESLANFAQRVLLNLDKLIGNKEGEL